MKPIFHAAGLLVVAIAAGAALSSGQESTTGPALRQAQGGPSESRAAALPEPDLRMDGGRFYFETRGDARNIQLLAGLLKDDDPLVRERVALDLGQTDNSAASPHLRGLLKDPDLRVRCAALAALGEVEANHAVPLVTAALGEPEAPMVLTALRLVGGLRLVECRPAVESALSRKEPAVLTTALGTLTDLGLPAPAGPLQALLAHSLPAVRLAAARNALLLPPAKVPVEAIAKVARGDSPQVRAAALAVLAKADFSAAAPLLEEVAKSPDPALRRGAVWGWRYAAKADRIRPFLNDEHPMVLLAAIEAAGELQCADCIPRLFELLPAARDHLSHLAARQALARIAQDAVPLQAADALLKMKTDLLRVAGSPDVEKGGDMTGRIGPAPAADMPTVVRNARAYAWLLGQYRSSAGLDTQLELVRRLPVDCHALIDLAGALARIGDERAVGPLRSALETCAANVHGYLVVQRRMQGSHKPFAEEVTAALIQAAGDLRAYPALPVIVRLVQANFEGEKLKQSAAAAARALPLLASDATRANVEKAVAVLLRDRDSHGPETAFEACKAAARLKMNSALPVLNEVLADRDRSHNGRQLIHVSAWAIGQLTGRFPPLPEAPRRQGDSWILRVSE